MISLVDNATNIIVSFLLQVHTAYLILCISHHQLLQFYLFQAAFFELSMGPLKIVGAGVVLVSVILIGGRQVWRARKTDSQ